MYAISQYRVSMFIDWRLALQIYVGYIIQQSNWTVICVALHLGNNKGKNCNVDNWVHLLEIRERTSALGADSVEHGSEDKDPIGFGLIWVISLVLLGERVDLLLAFLRGCEDKTVWVSSAVE